MKPFIPLIALSLLSVEVAASDALTIGENVYRVTANTSVIRIRDAFDANGDKVPLGAALGAQVNGMGMLGGLWAPGAINPQVSPEIDIVREDFSVEYGITDRLNFLMQIPTYPSARVTMNPNADMRAAVSALNAANVPGSTPYLFDRQLQEGARSTLLGDIMVGAKYQLFNTANERANAMKGGHLPRRAGRRYRPAHRAGRRSVEHRYRHHQIGRRDHHPRAAHLLGLAGDRRLLHQPGHRARVPLQGRLPAPQPHR